MHCENADLAPSDLPWLLLGVHSARIDVESRDLLLNEALGLTCACYADILLKLTEKESLAQFAIAKRPHNTV